MDNWNGYKLGSVREVVEVIKARIRSVKINERKPVLYSKDKTYCLGQLEEIRWLLVQIEVKNV